MIPRKKFGCEFVIAGRICLDCSTLEVNYNNVGRIYLLS